MDLAHAEAEHPATLSQHMHALESLCRVCGKNVKVLSGKDTGCSKTKYAEELHGLYNVDVLQEDPSIFGQVLCASHRQLCTKFRDAKARGKIYYTSVSMYQFEPHSETCSICSADVKLHKKRRHYSPRHGEDKPSQLTSSDLIQQYQALPTVERKLFLEQFPQFLDERECETLAYHLGCTQQEAILQDIPRTAAMYNDIEQLLSVDKKNWLVGRNIVLQEFIKGLSNLGVVESQRKRFILAQITEQVYRLRHAHYVGPISFMQMLNIYKATGSKQAV